MGGSSVIRSRTHGAGGSAATVPPRISAIWRTIARPGPEPGAERAAGERQKRSTTYGRSASGIPGPSSPTDTAPQDSTRTPSARRAGSGPGT